MTNRENRLNILLIDDEIEACDNLRNILTTYVEPDINILGVAHDTKQAEILINETHPDAIFLDIEMPDENAFQFLKRIMPVNFEIIFVTAYDNFAIKAFKLNAVDYILKPISIDELSDAVAKLKQKLSIKQLLRSNENDIEVLKQIANKERQHKIALRTFNHIEMVDFKDIYFIEANGSYCRFCFKKNGADEEATISNTIAEYEELFPSDIFFRIHKSYLVNCMHISKIRSDDTYEVITNGKYTLPVSRRRYASFIDFMKTNKYI